MFNAPSNLIEGDMPKSWRHFCYGMAYLNRLDGRITLREATAARVAGAVEDDYTSWRADLKRMVW